MSKLLRGYQSLDKKNKHSFIEVDLLLLAANLAIASFSDHSSYL